MTTVPVKSANITELFSLRGKVALITGATGHLGGAMADALAVAGASVVVSSRTLAHAQAVAESFRTRPVIGQRITIIPNHICPCVNLQDSVWLRQADGSFAVAGVDTRGRFS